MSGEVSSFRPGRRFSKRMLIANNMCAWGTIFVSLYLGVGVANIAVPAMATFLFAMFGAYTGVGHLDMRAATVSATNTPIKEVTDDEEER